MPFAIDRTVLAAASSRDDGILRIWSLQQSEPVMLALCDAVPGNVEGWSAYPAGAAWALAQSGAALSGADLLLDGNVPAGSGLSSSAAVEAVTALALAELQGALIEPAQLALVAQRAEVEFVGVPCGVMDQMASVLSRAGHALFLDTRTLDYQHVPFDPEADGLRLVVVDTRAPRQLVEGAYAKRRESCTRASQALGVAALRDATLEDVTAESGLLGKTEQRRARHVVTENARVLEAVELLRHRDWQRLGRLLTASHQSLRDDYEVSTPELNTAVESAVAAGALGARMTGAGFGGCAIALVTANDLPLLEKQVAVAFTRRAFNQPMLLPVRATHGARRVK